MSGPTLHVGIIDQQRIFVDALVYRLESEAGIEVVCAPDDAGLELAPIIASQPDLVILDAELPRSRAFDLACEIRRKVPAVRILFLTQYVNDLIIGEALRQKADGILSRDEPLVSLVRAIRQIGAGETAFSEAIEERLEFNPARRTYRLRVDGGINEFSERQLEILRYLARGESVKDVAQKLLISPKAVDNHKFRIMAKIGVNDKVSLALYAVREGLIRP